MRGRKPGNSLYRNQIERDMLVLYWRKQGLCNWEIGRKLKLSQREVNRILDEYPSAGFAKNGGNGKERPCLQCNKSFKRDKTHKWICPRCRIKYANDDPPLFEIHDAGNLAKKIRALDDPVPKPKWAWKYEVSAVRGPEGKRRLKLEKRLSQL